LSGLESLLSEAHQKHRVRERISGETRGLEMALARVTKEVYLYKIIFGHCDIDPHIFFYFNVLSKTLRNHNFKIRPKKTGTNYFTFSFFNRYITDWNSIPSNIMHAFSLSTSFKSYLLDQLCQF